MDGGRAFAVTASGFWANIDSAIRAGGSGGHLGTRLDLEQDLGLDDNDFRFIGGIGYRLNRRHGFDLSYFDLKRNAERTISRDFEFLDRVFSREASIGSSLNTEVWRLSYSYAFLDNARHRATAQVGIHYTTISARIAGRTTAQGEASEKVSTDTPLPVLGLGYAYRFSPRWMVELRGQIFRLRVEDTDGRIDNFSAAVAVKAIPTLSVFAGYTYYLMDVDLDKRRWHGEAKLDYRGPWVGPIRRRNRAGISGRDVRSRVLVSRARAHPGFSARAR